jgi:hypothetical protein
MTGFLGTSVTISLNYNQYSAIADLHNFQFTVAPALGFSVSTSRLLATDLNTETSISNLYEVFLPFLVQASWNLGNLLRVKLFSAESESETYVTTDGQPASLSWNKTPFWGLRPDLYYCLKVAGLMIWGALSDERTGL